MRSIWVGAVLLTMAGCGDLALLPQTPAQEPAEDPAAEAIVPEPEPVANPVVDAPPPPKDARTEEQFDTTTAEERAEAAAAPAEPEGERKLGDTVASLGDPARPGFWIETPLVSAPGRGRVFYAVTGKSAQVDLIPADGPATGGSRLSLAAMRLIEAPLTDLPTVEVYTGGSDDS
ncbi:hypothetical protein [Cognatishimia sp. F0-27]|uniref:hypothetical protein n=1 Tax=Cognatishimia sp. F0-27 TaxID=2816855 RepID=UPI001D0C4B56|nr:hypothetical protein [Cognatishimia sp. F0-27]MCC1494382.1 hypothetical protein [Cognatishimia sp. F0-27]